MTSDRVPAELLRAVVEYYKPRRVILFGSQARGDYQGDSDYDLLVVIDDDFPREKLTGPQAARPRGRYRGPVDILPMRHGVFEDRATIIGSLANTAEEEGIIVYDRAQAAE
jgi:uncharacterized protein